MSRDLEETLRVVAEQLCPSTQGYRLQNPEHRYARLMRSAAEELEEMRGALEKLHAALPMLKEADEVLHPRETEWILVDRERS